jgi:hypothetical protein
MEAKDGLITVSEGAKMLGVSYSYLRNCDCPKVLLPTTNPKRPLVRIRRSDFDEWVEKWSTKPKKKKVA